MAGGSGGSRSSSSISFSSLSFIPSLPISVCEGTHSFTHSLILNRLILSPFSAEELSFPEQSRHRTATRVAPPAGSLGRVEELLGRLEKGSRHSFFATANRSQAKPSKAKQSYSSTQ
mmetsp:Transcript_6604/g.13385  ORF Transcript_6604/g.13385 Transcript_6604/m.13385 type:complete len:117 (-) Transcript_6604:1689-2039(-)